MVENQHRLIKGYTDMPQGDIDVINKVKDGEKLVADLHNAVKAHITSELNPSISKQNERQRQLALARTKFEDAFSHLVRAVAQPDSPWL